MSDGNTGMQTTVKTCECGCGQPAPIATYTNRKMGYRRGEPIIAIGKTWKYLED
jgi:hypothetical protein